MATRIYKLNPGETEFKVEEGVGSATASKAIELTVDLATSVVNEDGSTRAVSKEEVLLALDMFRNHILKSTWLPA